MPIGLGEMSPSLAERRGYFARTDLTAIVAYAIELGVAHVEVDRDPDARRAIGDVVRALRARDRVTVATRIDAAVEPGSEPWLRIGPSDRLVRALPPGYVRTQIDDQLRATQLEVMPLAFVRLDPAWAGSSAWPELVDTCTQLVRAGKVLAWGGFLVEPTLAALALLGDPFATVSVPYALCDRAAEPLLDAIAAREPGARPRVHVRRALAGGALSGNLAPGVKLAVADDRLALDDDDLERIAVGVAKLASLVEKDPPAASSCPAAKAARGPLARPAHVECVTVPELAIRWLLGRPGVDLVVPRVHQRDYLPDLVAWSHAPPISAALRARVDVLSPPPPSPT